MLKKMFISLSTLLLLASILATVHAKETKAIVCVAGGEYCYEVPDENVVAVPLSPVATASMALLFALGAVMLLHCRKSSEVH